MRGWHALAPVRLAARTLRRDLRRQARLHALVAVLIALPVAAGVYLAVAQRSVLDDRLIEAREAGVGNADTVVELYRTDANGPGDRPDTDDEEAVVDGELAQLVAALERQADSVLLRWRLTGIGGPVPLDTVVAADWRRPLAAGAFASVEGRLPANPGEVALTPQGTARFGVGLGDRWPTAEGSEATVVGIVTPWTAERAATVYVADTAVAPSAAWSAGGWSTPGIAVGVEGLDPDQVDSILTAAGSKQPGGRWGHVSIDGDLVSRPAPYYRFEPDSRPEQLGVLVTAGLLVETGLLAAVAFVVRARRRSAEIGRLQALGADPSQVTWMMLAEAAVVGLVGAALGAVVALAAARVGLTTLGRVGSGFGPQSASIRAIRVSTSDVALPVGAAVTAAVGAAWLPSRRAARLSSQLALGDGSVQRPLGRRWPLLGVGLLAAAAGVFWLAAAIDQAFLARPDGNRTLYELVPVVVTVGLALLLAAVLVFAAVVVARLDGRGRSLPPMARAGLRALTRNRARSTALVGASTVICLLAVTAVVVASSGRSRVVADTTWAAVSGPDDRMPWFDPGDGAVPQPAAPDDDRVVDEVRAVVAFERVIPLHEVAGPGGDRAVLWLGPDPERASEGVTAHVATDDLLDLLDLDPVARTTLERPGVALLTSRPAEQQGVLVSDETVPPAAIDDQDPEQPWAAVHFELISVERPDLARLGIEALISPHNPPDDLTAVARARWVIGSDDGFSADELAWLSGDGRHWVPTEPDPWRQDRGVQLIGLAVAAVLVLAVARVTAALVALETDADTRTMIAVGAPRWARQRLLGAQALVLVGIGVVLAVPLGLGLAWFVLANDGATVWRPIVPRYLVTGLGLLPVVAAAVVAVTTRSAPAATSRRLT